MANRVSEQNYENMIEALVGAAHKIYGCAEQMMGYANTCASALGDGDEAIPKILENVTTAQQGYSECAASAMQIAQAMQEELDEMRKERDVWESEE